MRARFWRRTGLRTPILVILFLVGLKSWVGKGSWVATRESWERSRGVKEVVFSSDGRYILGPGFDRTVRMWDTETGDCLLDLEGHELAVNSAAFSPGRDRIVTASDDRTVRVWEVETGKCILVLDQPAKAKSALFSRSGDEIVGLGAESRVRVWDAETEELRRTFPRRKDELYRTVSSDGGSIVTASSPLLARLWDVETGRCLQVLDVREWSERSTACRGIKWVPGFVYAECSPDAAFVMTASAETVHIWDGRTGEALRILRGHEEPVRCGVFSPDGSRVLTVDEGGAARIWHTSKGECASLKTRIPLPGYQPHYWYPRLWQAAFSPDGRRIAYVSEFRRLHICDARTGDELARLGGRPIVRFAFSPEGKCLVTMGTEGELCLWKRRKPEWSYGYLWLPEVWLTIAVGVAFVASLARDVKG